MPYADPEAKRAQSRRYYAVNRERMLAAAATRRRDNPGIDTEVNRRWRAAHREEMNAAARAGRAANPESRRAYEARYREGNREKRRAAGRVYQAGLDPARAAAYGRNKVLRKYGLTNEEYAAMRVAQGQACALCLVAFRTDREPHIDHDHRTGAVRGLLCSKCNQALGLFHDNPTSMRAAAAYVERYRCRT